MMKKGSTSSKVEGAIAKSVNFELTIADLAKRSERRAWWVAFGAIVMALILACGYFYMLPLKEKIPYIVMADAYTGTSTVARLTPDFTHRRISTSDAINRSNVAHFVLARESYDLAMVNLRDWATVQSMSAPGVRAAYTRLYSSANPDSLYKKYGKDTAIRVKILSIVLSGGGPGIAPKGATVRFQRSLYNKQTGTTHPLDNKIATLSFAYKTNLDMDDQSRIENPLGFWVTDYRVDDDYSSSPPEEVMGTPAAPTQPPAEDPAATPAATSTQATPLGAPTATSQAPSTPTRGAGTP